MVPQDQFGIMDLHGTRNLDLFCNFSGCRRTSRSRRRADEAFATQSLAVIREAGLDPARVNPNGGAIALGHPLGCTGAKLTATLIRELGRRGGRYGMVTMCVGGGMGAAGIFEIVK